jgi:hypothetical protein
VQSLEVFMRWQSIVDSFGFAKSIEYDEVVCGIGFGGFGCLKVYGNKAETYAHFYLNT